MNGVNGWVFSACIFNFVKFDTLQIQFTLVYTAFHKVAFSWTVFEGLTLTKALADWQLPKYLWVI